MKFTDTPDDRLVAEDAMRELGLDWVADQIASMAAHAIEKARDAFYKARGLRQAASRARFWNGDRAGFLARSFDWFNQRDQRVEAAYDDEYGDERGPDSR